MELFGGLVVFVNRSAVGAAQLDRMGDDSRQYGFEVESGADYLADFAEGFELAYRACQFVGSLIQFFEQAHVLDGNHGLVGEGFEKLDLFFGEGPDLGAPDHNGPDGDSFPQQGGGKDCSRAGVWTNGASGNSVAISSAMSSDMNCLPVDDGSAHWKPDSDG